ncbi:hypothetical protein ACHAXS_004195 [Conticribra weissflogii]
MLTSSRGLLVFLAYCGALAPCNISYALTNHRSLTPCLPTTTSNRLKITALKFAMEPPKGGFAVVNNLNDGDVGVSSLSSSVDSSASPIKRIGLNSRGAKMNEIDFTLAPSDVSLSKCYQMSASIANNVGKITSTDTSETSQSLQEQQRQRVQNQSLTRALNTASNRALRRILLARSWPSAEALNLSLRTVLKQEQKQQENAAAEAKSESRDVETDAAKCPVPRPILNILMRRRDAKDGEDVVTSNERNPTPRSSAEKEKDWIVNQIGVFRESYGDLPGYDEAEAYLECILSLATCGEESVRVNEVINGETYAGPYQRILTVIQNVGAVLEDIPGSKSGETRPRKRIAKKLLDQDICLSMLDKIAIANEKNRLGDTDRKGEPSISLAVPYDSAARLAYESDPNKSSLSFEDFKQKYEEESIALVIAKKKARDEQRSSHEKQETAKIKQSNPDVPETEGLIDRIRVWKWLKKNTRKHDNEVTDTTSQPIDEKKVSDQEPLAPIEEKTILKPDDLGGVLLSAEEPTMTRQLNVLSNIVQRTLIFGGDEELLVLAETLDADKPAFIQRWYESDPGCQPDIQAETRPGVQYLNSLIQLLRDCYTKGVLCDVTPTVPLRSGYRNAYERLTASLIELGSGYVRPPPSSSLSLAMTTTAATAKYLTSTAPPKSAREEFGRFAKWESAVRKNRENPYPDDLVGTWNVEDIVGGTVIGTTQVTFKPQGEVVVMPPMQGLRWRLDPGPTHLDTCTFQVLSDDGAILQYKGFVDRGSRLEARVSKRSVTMRGGVSFLMRDAEMGGSGILGDDSYWDDMLPINYKNGMTKFVMSRIVNGGNSHDSDKNETSLSSNK